MSTTETSDEPIIELAPEDRQPIIPAEEQKPEEQQSTSGQDDEDQYFIRIDKRKVSEEARRLNKEVPELANVFHSQAGERWKREYETKLEDESLAKQEALARAEAAEIRAMDPKDIEQKFISDPEFAVRYAKSIHAKPEDVNIMREQIRQRRELDGVAHEINTIYNDLLENGLPEEKTLELRKRVSSGEFDNVSSYTQGVAAISRAGTALLVEHLRSANVETNGNGAAPQKESKLVRSGPDTTQTGIVQSSMTKDNLKSYQAKLDSGGQLSSAEVDALTAEWLSKNT